MLSLLLDFRAALFVLYIFSVSVFSLETFLGRVAQTLFTLVILNSLLRVVEADYFR